MASNNRLYEKVIDFLAEELEQGRLHLHEKIPPERALAEQIGVSRGTLRDAFRVLESRGVIETRRGGGRVIKRALSTTEYGTSIVSQLEEAAIMDLLEVREVLEVGMAELVCERASDEELTEIEQKLLYTTKQEHQELKEENIGSYFHYSLAKTSKNQAMSDFIKLNIGMVDRARKLNYNTTDNFEESRREHLAVLFAVQARDPEQTKQRVKDHYKNIRKRLKQSE